MSAVSPHFFSAKKPTFKWNFTLQVDSSTPRRPSLPSLEAPSTNYEDKGLHILAGKPLQSRATIRVDENHITWESSNDLCSFYRNPPENCAECRLGSEVTNLSQPPPPIPTQSTISLSNSSHNDGLLIQSLQPYDYPLNSTSTCQPPRVTRSAGCITTTTQLHRNQVCSVIASKSPQKQERLAHLSSSTPVPRPSTTKAHSTLNTNSIYPLKKRPLINTKAWPENGSSPGAPVSTATITITPATPCTTSSFDLTTTTTSPLVSAITKLSVSRPSTLVTSQTRKLVRSAGKGSESPSLPFPPSKLTKNFSNLTALHQALFIQLPEKPPVPRTHLRTQTLSGGLVKAAKDNSSKPPSPAQVKKIPANKKFLNDEKKSKTLKKGLLSQHAKSLVRVGKKDETVSSERKRGRFPTRQTHSF